MKEGEKIIKVEKIVNDLAENYRNDEEVIENLLEEVSSIAFNISHNKDEDSLFPYVKKAVKAIYLCRGAEGLQSRSEGSISTSFEDIIEKLRNDIIKNGLRRMK